MLICSLFLVLAFCQNADYTSPLLDAETVPVGLSIFLVIYLTMSWNVLYKTMTCKIIEEAINMTCDTNNDDVFKPLVYFVFNIIPLMLPIIISL